MGKNGNKKNILIKSVNLGEPDNPARILAEDYIKIYGKQRFSSFIRNLICKSLSNDSEWDYLEIKALKEQRKKYSKEVQELSKKLRNNEDELKKLGVDLNDLVE